MIWFPMSKTLAALLPPGKKMSRPCWRKTAAANVCGGKRPPLGGGFRIHGGFFTQDIQGAELAASVLCQAWRTVAQPGRPPRLGVPEGPYLTQADAQGLQVFEKQLSCLEKAGCRIKSVPCLADIAVINARHRQLVFAEFAREHRELYAAYASLYRPRTREIIEIGKTVDRKTQLQAIGAAGRLRASLEALQRRRHIDLWLSPPAPGPGPAGSFLDRPSGHESAVDARRSADDNAAGRLFQKRFAGGTADCGPFRCGRTPAGLVPAHRPDAWSELLAISG